MKKKVLQNQTSDLEKRIEDIEAQVEQVRNTVYQLIAAQKEIVDLLKSLYIRVVSKDESQKPEKKEEKKNGGLETLYR